MSKTYSTEPSKTCSGCGQLVFIDDSNCICFPEFEDWKFDLTNERWSELACQFYEDNIDILYKTKVKYHPTLTARHELAEDAEDLILEGILVGAFFNDEWDSFLKGWYEEERGGR